MALTKISSDVIADLAVTTAKIAADAIDGTKLADNAVDSEHYTDGSADNVHLATGMAASKLTGSLPALTLAGALTGADQSVSAINLLDSGYITVAHGDTSGADIALNMNAGQHHSATISTDAVAISVTNATGADELQCGVLHLTNGGSQTVTFTAGDFAGGTAPTLTTSGLDVLAFWTYDGGTIVHWQVISTDSKSP